MQEAASVVGRAEQGKARQLCSSSTPPHPHPQQGESWHPHPHPQFHSSLSQQSDSSYDFLSAEEKECLLFLEKTIGSLEAEADSGLSTDESEPATSPRSFRALPTTTQQAPQGKRLSREATLRRPESPQHFPHLACPLGQVPLAERGAPSSPSLTKARGKGLPEKPASCVFR